jgi:uncharacterized protein (TIGR02452 family)
MREKEIARQTVEALNVGYYTEASGELVHFSSLLKQCVTSTKCYSPDSLSTVRDQALTQPARYERTVFEVVNETTLAGCERLLAANPDQRITVLNFASAKNPGGGFLTGARAQEESLVRSSGLYSSLMRCSDYYAFHRKQKSLLYSDRMIYSPDCPVLRDDQGEWLHQPYTVNFITSAAPNAGAIASNDPREAARIPDVFRERIGKVLGLAADQGCETLLLGAWGCGAFRNDPKLVARLFWDYLNPNGAYWGRFPKVVFSVLDRHESLGNFHAFTDKFANGA